MKNRRIWLVCLVFAVALPLSAANPRSEFETQVGNAIAKLNREAAGPDGALRLASLIQSEYGTPIEELRWAVENQLSWGQIVAFAYIHATNGHTFSELRRAEAGNDFWSYTEKAGMNSGKMARSLERFLKQAQQERNSRIFEQLRTTRRSSSMPDLGSGFGLFQEALDFRQVGSTPGPTKVYTVGGSLAKGEQ